MHPVFTIITLILIGYSFLEVDSYSKYRSVWGVVGIMIILIGLRYWVGADYNPYYHMYKEFGAEVDYSQLRNKALFGQEDLMVEWLYILLGKLLFDLSLPFPFFTLLVALISVPLKYYTFEKCVAYPSLSLLLYMYPSYFIADGGQMRQALAMGVTIFSFIFIQKRRLLLYLFIMYIAVGFHSSALIFLPAYWLAIIPMNSVRAILVILISVTLSPLQLYQQISMLEALVPSDAFNGFKAYDTIEEENFGSVKFTDLICIMYSYFLITYDKEACKKIPYYEYMRNIGIVGICMYFIFRGSPIFSSRLSNYYFIFMVLVIPNIIAGINKKGIRSLLHLFILGFIIFYYFVFSVMQAPKAGYNERYQNFLW